jgi:hypothetical protein
MNEVVRSKKGLGGLFNEENRLRVGERVTAERLRKRGYIPFLEYYLQIKYGDVYKPRKS